MRDKRLNGKNCNTEACKEVRRSNMPSGKNGSWDPPDARKTGNGTTLSKVRVVSNIKFRIRMVIRIFLITIAPEGTILTTRQVTLKQIQRRY